MNAQLLNQSHTGHLVNGQPVPCPQREAVRPLIVIILHTKLLLLPSLSLELERGSLEI